jgi:ubiquinone/menaquinone biosynthesis C-methylase UbiE
MAHCFPLDRLERITELEGWHFWFAGRRVLVERLLRKHLGEEAQLILDLGCGSGLTLETLTRHGHRAVGLDLRPEGLRRAVGRLARTSFVQADATRLPFKEDLFGAVTMLDVLEHVDDRALLSEVWKVLLPGGQLLLTVPAMPWLWSYRDEAAGHLRRYTRRRLRAVLSEAGFRIEEIRYYQFLLFPFVVLTRLVGRRAPAARDFEERSIPFLSSLFKRVNKLEARLSDRLSWPWGSSLAVVCRKV